VPKVWQCLSENTQQSIRAIAAVTGIPKSSVHRHLKAIERRQQHAESYLWETAEGGEWRKLMVFGVIYCFGIKGGIGADSLSDFFSSVALGAADCVLPVRCGSWKCKSKGK
jgi:hypothetical protein